MGRLADSKDGGQAVQGSHGGHNGLDRGNAWDLGVSGTENDPKSWTKDMDRRTLLAEEDGEDAPLLNVYLGHQVRLSKFSRFCSADGDGQSHT